MDLTVRACAQGPIGFRFPILALQLAGRDPDQLREGEDAILARFEQAITAIGWKSLWLRTLAVGRTSHNKKTQIYQRTSSFEISAKAA